MLPGHSVIAKEAILLGGGHTHALVLRHLGMHPIPGVRLTLISDVTHTPYSGMLPGTLCGTYTYDESHIDLRRLCEFAGARFVLAKVSGLDLDSHRVHLADHPAIDGDLWSINIGSTPDIDVVPGAREFATPVKPVPKFLNQWHRLLEEIKGGNTPSIVFVGGGAGGVELALAYRQRLGPNVPIHLVDRELELLSSHNARVRRLLTEHCRKRKIQLHLGESVVEVQRQGVTCKSGHRINADQVVWVTGASAPGWLGESGLAVDEGGFIRVGPSLQSESHPYVFAAGDIATITNHHRPKSGVFAVRASKPLAANMRRYFDRQALIEYMPQKQFLSLMSTANGEAVASRGILAWHGPMMWRLKDAIDRKFMRQFSALKPMPSDTPSRNRSPKNHALSESARLVDEPMMRCQGCAAKVGAPILERVLKRIRENYPDVAHVESKAYGLNSPDDAAVLSVPEGLALVQSNDYFPAILSDPFVFGRILALHCFSDVYAMGAWPHSANALVLVPFAENKVMEQDIYLCMAGVAHELQAAGAKLLGGHTAEGDRLGLGLICNGLFEPNQLLRKQGMQPGDLLLLTKPLGIGALFAAQMRMACKGRWIDAAIHSMLVSNGPASKCFLKNEATACTDVTGFGLLGHLWEMMRGSSVCVELELNQIPFLEGAANTVEAGITSSIAPSNRQIESHVEFVTDVVGDPKLSLLFDPQTSGGLIASLPPERAKQCLAELQQAGCQDSAIVGRVSQHQSEQRPIVVHSTLVE